MRGFGGAGRGGEGFTGTWRSEKPSSAHLPFRPHLVSITSTIQRPLSTLEIPGTKEALRNLLLRLRGPWLNSI